MSVAGTALAPGRARPGPPPPPLREPPLQAAHPCGPVAFLSAMPQCANNPAQFQCPNRYRNPQSRRPQGRSPPLPPSLPPPSPLPPSLLPSFSPSSLSPPSLDLAASPSPCAPAASSTQRSIKCTIPPRLPLSSILRRARAPHPSPSLAALARFWIPSQALHHASIYACTLRPAPCEPTAGRATQR